MDRSKQIAAGLTFLVCCLLLIWLLVAKLGWDPAQVWPPEPDPYIAMADEPEEEFIEVKVVPPPMTVEGIDPAAPAQTPEDMDNEAQPGPETGTNLSSQGPVDRPAKTVTTPKPSPVKEKKEPTPAKSAAAVENARQKEEKALAQRTNNATKNAFAKAENKNNANNGTKDQGNAGRKNGNPDSAGAAKSTGNKPGSASGTVGGRWAMPAYSQNIPSNEVGSVTFEVVVNKDGTPGKIQAIDNKGLSSETIARCRKEIQGKRFTHPNPSEAEPATARITFRFRDPS